MAVLGIQYFALFLETSLKGLSDAGEKVKPESGTWEVGRDVSVRENGTDWCLNTKLLPVSQNSMRRFNRLIP